MDHVFGEALGGRVKVAAHKTCNNQFGSGPEGILQRPNSPVNWLKAMHGLHAQPVRVTFPSGRPASLDLTSGNLHAPPTVTRSKNGLAVRIEGTPDQVETAYTKMRSRSPGLGLPAYADLPAECIGAVSYDSARVDLSLPLASAEAVAVKSALGACTLAYGPAFASTPLAVALRAIQDSPVLQGPAAAEDHLSVLDAHIAETAASVGLASEAVSTLPRLVPPPGATAHDVILVPYRQQTLLFAHYLSVAIPPYGFTVKAPLPPFTDGLQAAAPLLLRDGGSADCLEITDFTQILMQPVIDAAIASGQDLDAR
jgi:hypothetical protein